MSERIKKDEDKEKRASHEDTRQNTAGVIIRDRDGSESKRGEQRDGEVWERSRKKRAEKKQTRRRRRKRADRAREDEEERRQLWMFVTAALSKATRENRE